jgi:hypothetical protein
LRHYPGRTEEKNKNSHPDSQCPGQHCGISRICSRSDGHSTTMFDDEAYYLKAALPCKNIKVDI